MQLAKDLLQLRGAHQVSTEGARVWDHVRPIHGDSIHVLNHLSVRGRRLEIEPRPLNAGSVGSVFVGHLVEGPGAEPIPILLKIQAASISDSDEDVFPDPASRHDDAFRLAHFSSRDRLTLEGSAPWFVEALALHHLQQVLPEDAPWLAPRIYGSLIVENDAGARGSIILMDYFAEAVPLCQWTPTSRKELANSIHQYLTYYRSTKRMLSMTNWDQNCNNILISDADISGPSLHCIDFGFVEFDFPYQGGVVEVRTDYWRKLADNGKDFAVSIGGGPWLYDELPDDLAGAFDAALGGGKAIDFVLGALEISYGLPGYGPTRPVS